MSSINLLDLQHELRAVSEAGDSFVDKAKYRRVASALAPGRGGDLEESFVAAQLGLIEAAARQEKDNQAKLLALLDRRAKGKPVTQEELFAVRRAMSEAAHVRAIAVDTIQALHVAKGAIHRDAWS